MRVYLSRLAALSLAAFPAVAVLIAFGLISYGVSLWSYPAGFVAGGVLLALAVIDARR